MVLLVQVEFALECTSPIKALTLAETIRQQIGILGRMIRNDSGVSSTEVTVGEHYIHCLDGPAPVMRSKP